MEKWRRESRCRQLRAGGVPLPMVERAAHRLQCLNLYNQPERLFVNIAKHHRGLLVIQGTREDLSISSQGKDKSFCVSTLRVTFTPHGALQNSCKTETSS